MNKILFVLPLIIFSLILAVWTGIIRIGWQLPVSNSAAQHGALMVGSFLSSLIFLERAITFKNKIVLLLPFINGLSVVAFILKEPTLAQLLLIIGSFGFVVMCAFFIYLYKEFYYYVFFIGAFCLLTGNIILYKTLLYAGIVNWWMGFLLFTIVAERLELSRFLPLKKYVRILLIGIITAVFVSLFLPYSLINNIFFAISISASGLWLLRFDMAWHSIKIKGQHRYSGLLLITGYVWLIVTAVLLITGNKLLFGYDAALHSFFIGFVFSMIFSHAPIILPAILKMPVKLYRPLLYILFIVLQLSLIVRITADAFAFNQLRKVAGMINGLTIIVFFITIVFILSSELKRMSKASVKT